MCFFIGRDGEQKNSEVKKTIEGNMKTYCEIEEGTWSCNDIAYDKDGEINSAKVYFGNSDQQWWIAGSQQEHGLTLLAASPLATNLEFEPDRSKKYMKAVGIVHILMVSHQKFMQATMGQVL